MKICPECGGNVTPKRFCPSYPDGRSGCEVDPNTLVCEDCLEEYNLDERESAELMNSNSR